LKGPIKGYCLLQIPPSCPLFQALKHWFQDFLPELPPTTRGRLSKGFPAALENNTD
jgi:hypothetical protein